MSERVSTVTPKGRRRRARPDAPTPPAGGNLRVLLVTGMSGAGKTSALKSLEDLGYEAVDNLPLTLLQSLVLPRRPECASAQDLKPVAIGVDVRTRDFGVAPIIGEMDRLSAEPRIDASVLFLDCDDEELMRRYAETRYRHPLALDRPIRDGIDHERRLVAGLRDWADVVVDTTGLDLGSLKRVLDGHFGAGAGERLSIFVTSFSFRRGSPREADLVLDVRFLSNPHYEPALRLLDGLDAAVATFIERDPGLAPLFNGLTGMLSELVPRYAAEGKSYLTVALGCTGGRHRSVFVAERLAAWLAKQGGTVRVHHRDLDADTPAMGGAETS
ncbi:MAG: RNase adapter RapZ [Rhodospirillales bacterium]|jgi:UPF0042 nucleotide-binding protein|nr:RNase adapter RapZ [Rhodospirillales bacterium]MDP6803717.1 RNase adapter RapZ [Rhodospirillales bacterium]